MTRDTRLTTALCAGAAALLLLTWATAPRVKTPAAFAERGEKMFPQFQDPNAAVSLEITAFDSRTAALRTFKVQNRNGRWTIPSQHDYPAESGDRLAQIAGSLVALKKDDVVSDNASDHTRCDVVDPLDQTVPSLVGRGTRLVVRGAQDAVLADVIVGKVAEGHQGYRYVRQPAQTRVYASYVGELKISVEFGDWIERDLLKIAPDEIDAVNIRSYSLDRGTSQFRAGDTLLLESNRAGTWGLQGLAAANRVRLAAIDKMLRALANLRVAGVTPKSPGIAAILGQEADRASITQDDRADMARKGFYLTPDGQLLSNHGEVVVRTTRGIFYTLRFGDIATDVDVPAEAVSEGAAAEPALHQESRYLFVMVNFDRGSARTPELAAEGEEQTRALRPRLAPWYYVIAGQSYADIRVTREQLVEPAAGRAPHD